MGRRRAHGGSPVLHFSRGVVTNALPIFRPRRLTLKRGKRAVMLHIIARPSWSARKNGYKEEVSEQGQDYQAEEGQAFAT
jgi:hypothetical protein